MKALSCCVATGMLMAVAGPAFCQQPFDPSLPPIKATARPAPQPDAYKLLPEFIRYNIPLFDPGVQPAVAQPKKEGEQPKKGEKEPPKKSPKDEQVAEFPTDTGEPPIGLNPRMIGELPTPFFSLKSIIVPATQIVTQFKQVTVLQNVQQTIINSFGQPQVITVQVPVVVTLPFTTTRTTFVTTITRVPIVTGGALKIAENESPLPEDRVFLTYNYYDSIHGPNGSFGLPTTLTTQATIGGIPTTIATIVPGVPPPTVNLHREAIGFEKSFFDGFASIGLRSPFSQVTGDGGFTGSNFGDMSVIMKVAPILDRDTGSGLSTGLLVTVPTGPAIDTYLGNVHTTIFQPFMGYRLNGDRAFVQGFSSIALPAGHGLPTLFFNDVGVGYWLYRGQRGDRITGIVPVLELHLTTPLDHRQAADPVTFSDLLVLTGGVHIGLGPRTTLTFGVTTPIAGQRIYSVEAGAQLNFRF